MVPATSFGGSATAADEGDFRSRVVLLECPAYNTALTVYRSEEDQAAHEIRLSCSESSILVTEGLAHPWSPHPERGRSQLRRPGSRL